MSGLLETDWARDMANSCAGGTARAEEEGIKEEEDIRTLTESSREGLRTAFESDGSKGFLRQILGLTLNPNNELIFSKDTPSRLCHAGNLMTECSIQATGHPEEARE